MYVEMSVDTASIAVLILLAFLSIIVCISNAFTVFVFWVHHSKLKRTSFLVINLAVADLLIGLTDTVEVGAFALPRHIGSNETITEMKGSIIGFSLITICVSYLSIRKRINNRSPVIDTELSRISIEQSTKLSKTLFIMIGTSAALWLPSVTWYNVSVWFPSLFPHFVAHLSTMVHLTNSLVNPVIYSLKMPIFRRSYEQLRDKIKLVKRAKTYTVN